MVLRRAVLIVGVVVGAAAGCSKTSTGDGRSAPPCNDEPFSNEVCIAEGSFLMGHPTMPDGLPGHSPFSPVHKVTLPSFFIDVDPVSNGEYRACFEAGACPDECQRATSRCLGSFAESYSMLDPKLADYPMATATIDGAEAYCRWMGKRLPSEAEWERAARGPKSFDYPWGNSAPDCAALHCDLPSFDRDFPHTPGSYPVGMATADVSPEGVRGMLTTVRQLLREPPAVYTTAALTNPLRAAQPYEARATRGNLSFYGAIHGVYNGVSYPLPAWERSSHYTGGLRCARSDSPVVLHLERAVKLRQNLLASRKLRSLPRLPLSGGQP